MNMDGKIGGARGQVGALSRTIKSWPPAPYSSSRRPYINIVDVRAGIRIVEGSLVFDPYQKLIYASLSHDYKMYLRFNCLLRFNVYVPRML